MQLGRLGVGARVEVAARQGTQPIGARAGEQGRVLDVERHQRAGDELVGRARRGTGRGVGGRRALARVVAIAERRRAAQDDDQGDQNQQTRHGEPWHDTNSFIIIKP